jgi:TP901 family phage tail tape measure protein
MAGIRINILSNFNAGGFDKLQRELKRLDTPMEKLGAVTKSLAPMATVAFGALAFGAAKSVTAANDLALGLREVVTLTGDTGDQANKTFGEMQGLVRTVSNEFAIAQDVLTKGLYQALSAGVPKDNALEFMQVASKAAIAGVTSVDTAVDGLTTTINAFGLDIGQAGAVADSMFAAVKGGKTTFDQLSSALFNVAPAAAAAKVEFSEVNAAIATLTASGVPTSVATTQIRAAFVALSKPSKELTALFNSLGYESGEAAIAQNGLQFAMDAVYKASNGSAAQMKLLLGRQEAVNAINVLAGTSAGKFADELARQAKAAGSVDDAFNEIDKSRSLEKNKIAFENIGLAVGTILIPVMEAVIPLITSFAKFAEENATVVVVLASVLGVLAAAILAVNFALNANPIVKVITLIAALAAGVVLLINWLVKLYGGWDKLFKDIGKLLEGFASFFKTVWDGITSVFTSAVNGYIGIWEGFINRIISGLNGVISLANSALSLIASVTGGVIDIKIPTIPNVNVPKVGGAKTPAKTPAKAPVKAPKVVKIPKLATGGIVMPVPGGVLANLAEAGQPEAVIPLNKLGQFTDKKPTVIYNINVSGGLDSGASIGKRVIEAIKAYERTSGAVFQGA